MASSSHAAAEASSSRSSKQYDVFLSFRGEDVRKTFVDHLYSALVDKQIQTYKDDETLSRGESIRPSLFKAIEQSHIAIIIFSKHYADSSWCLDELAHIMKCREEKELTVMPVFYDVDPSDVRKQKGDFGKAFAQLQVENINKAQSWRNALVDASNIAGWEPKYVANGHESKVIKEIIVSISNTLPPLNLEANEDLVGMKTRLQYLKPLLEIGSDGVRMIGIWGLGGSGKTTLATSLFMEIYCHFEGHHIIENVREESSKNGLKKLQENILSAFSKTKVEVHSILQGTSMIKNMLSRRNVLVLLDDVDELDQLEALAGSHDWFGSGSRIIITTRDEHLLRTHKVDKVSHVRLLSDDEATRLFNRHAYNEKFPIEDYETLSLRVVKYAAGLPLALKVLGSFLYDKEKKGWISTLDRLKDIPESKILEKLIISYDGLKDVEKKLFLDIACFFRGSYKDDTMEALEACNFHPEIGIEVLREKSLITMSRDGRFDMHDLVQEMGHYIVRGEHPNNPDQHSRLWDLKEMNKMCFGDATMENDKIEAIHYVDDTRGHDTSQLCKIVSNAKQLRYLRVQIHFMSYVKGATFFSNELCYLHWNGYPARSPFPDGFQGVKLVVLKLSKSYQKELWKGCKHLPLLKVLELFLMRELLKTPNFDELPCLQNLTLSGCLKLKEIHPSLGNHKNLQDVTVLACNKLRMFPTIVHMKNLKNLRIEYCPKIHEFPKIQANIEGLVNLSMRGTGVNVLPSSIGSNDFSRLDFNLSQLTQLKYLDVSDCKKLLELPELPSSLTTLDARFCPSLTTFGDCHKNCRRLCEVSLSGGSMINDGGKLLESMIELCIANENHYMLLQLTGLEIAKGFTPPLLTGGKCTLQLPDNWCNDYSGFLMCAVMPYFNTAGISMNGEKNFMDSKTAWWNFMFWEESDRDIECTTFMFVSFDSLRQTAWWNHTYKALVFQIHILYPFGVRLIEKKSRSGPTKTSTNSTSSFSCRSKPWIEHDSMSPSKINFDFSFHN